MNMNVIIYTNSLCGYCYSAKSLLKRENIPYKEINIDLDYENGQKIKWFNFCSTNFF